MTFNVRACSQRQRSRSRSQRRNHNSGRRDRHGDGRSEDYSPETKPGSAHIRNKDAQKVENKHRHSNVSLKDLPEMPYILLASMIDERDLCHMDATCRLFAELNCECGPWRALGETTFAGVQLEGTGAFGVDGCGRGRINWKSRYRHFKLDTPKFRYPFAGTEITEIKNDDEVAHLKWKLRIDQLCQYSDRGIYVEVEVASNADNVSLSIVDEEDSVTFTNVTFSPELGAVFKEKIIQDLPRRLMGMNYYALKPKQIPFEGQMGLFVCNGRIAFFRRCSQPDIQRYQHDDATWETTGFVSDLTWAKDRKLTPCVAFRNKGSYNIRVVRVGSCPPIWPEVTQGAEQDGNWSTFVWNSEDHYLDNVTIQEAYE